MPSTQFGHISEFYETLLTSALILLTILELGSFVYNLHESLTKSSLSSHRAQTEWTQSRAISSDTKPATSPEAPQEQYDLEKSVANYVQNEITNMEKTHEEQQKANNQSKQQQHNPSHPQQEQLDLPPNKQNFYRVYVAFNHFMDEKMAILIPILVLGILTQSTYVYSLAAFFFSFLCELLVQVLDAEDKLYKKKGSGLRKWIKMLGNLFVMSIFISYWAVNQFDAS